MKKIVRKVMNKLRYSEGEKSPETNPHSDITEKEFWELYFLCKPYTMTSVERMYSLYCAVDYVLSNNIEGDFVECGVWRGGSAMLMAKMLSNRNVTNRSLYLFDTFEGMSQPTDHDVAHTGVEASVQLKENLNNKETSVWCLADLTDVKNNMKKTNFPDANQIYVKGKVEDTLPANKPDGKIALLRLDTDWYESTKHELNVLFPALTQNGVLIIDDYGHWQGCRKAVDEYIDQNKLPLLLNRIDYTGRIAIKNFC